MCKVAQWSFFSNHACVIVLLAREPNQSLRKVAATIGSTERAVQRIVSELEAANYLIRGRVGRQNTYQINRDSEMRHLLLDNTALSKLLDVFNQTVEKEQFEEDQLLADWAVGEHGSEVK